MSVTLRYNEYRSMQPIFDNLYEKSKANTTDGIDLYSIITSRENILLAYRTIKSNTGSKTKGTDGLTIADYKIIDEKKFVKGIRQTLENYHPQMVRRVLIDKDNGKKRPLGIPTMRDRLIQQAFKQVLEPIVEAKFHNHSYGYRANRSTHHAMARSSFLINQANLHYVVDVDIKGFFDNVNHRKLIEQLHGIGIKDTKVLTIINKMLKAEIETECRPTKGTPQGGILSPLLSNVVLNEFDWWISRQWETFQTDKKYSSKTKKSTILKKSNLKPMYIVRYADDSKIFTNCYKNAVKIYHASKNYLYENLYLEISPEKSTITNLRKRKSDFLGFEISGMKKKKKYVSKLSVGKKKKRKMLENGRKLIIKVSKQPIPENVNQLNSWVLGLHNYFKIASHVNVDFSKIAYLLNRVMYNRFKSIGKYDIPSDKNRTYDKFYGRNNYKTCKIGDINIYPLADIKTKYPLCFSQDICNYTAEGRAKIHKQLGAILATEVHALSLSYIPNRSVEYADNRISRYTMQQGKCGVTGEYITASEVHCHHVIPVSKGGQDTFDNLIILHHDMHRLVHATDDEVIAKYARSLDEKSIEKINKLRESLEIFPLDVKSSRPKGKFPTENGDKKNEKDANLSRLVTY